MNKIIIFGASGDLARRKLMPAISRIYTRDLEVIGYSRSDLEGSFAQEMRKFFEYTTDFPEQVKYIRGQYDDLSPLKGIIDSSTILYFSVPPTVHDQILSSLASFDFGAVEIEKPFGNDFESFKNSVYFKDRRVHFIDHYLLKPLMISVAEILLNDVSLFDFLCSKTVSSIDCYFVESLLAEGRNYFEKNGMVKDVMQNHLVEVLSTILCSKHQGEVSPALRTEFIRGLKIDNQKYIFGQYETYQKDAGTSSEAETFAAFKCESSDRKWEHVPIVMIAGKGMNKKATEIVFNLRRSSFGAFIIMIQGRIAHPISEHGVKKMELVFNVAPTSEIYLKILTDDGPVRVVLYGKTCVEKIKILKFGDRQDYEIVFTSLLNKSYVPTVSYEEAFELWRMFDKINSAKRDLIYYKNGSEMPEEARKFIDAVKGTVDD